MIVFGWISMIALMLFGLFILGLLVGPFVLAKIKTFSFRLKRYIEDEKLDIDKRSDERRNRQEIKRTKDFELANKKLDIKLNKVNKQIKIQNEKLKLTEELRQRIEEEKSEYQNDVKIDTVRPEVKVIEENINDEE